MKKWYDEFISVFFSIFKLIFDIEFRRTDVYIDIDRNANV